MSHQPTNERLRWLQAAAADSNRLLQTPAANHSAVGADNENVNAGAWARAQRKTALERLAAAEEKETARSEQARNGQIKERMNRAGQAWHAQAQAQHKLAACLPDDGEKLHVHCSRVKTAGSIRVFRVLQAIRKLNDNHQCESPYTTCLAIHGASCGFDMSRLLVKDDLMHVSQCVLALKHLAYNRSDKQRDECHKSLAETLGHLKRLLSDRSDVPQREWQTINREHHRAQELADAVRHIHKTNPQPTGATPVHNMADLFDIARDVATLADAAHVRVAAAEQSDNRIGYARSDQGRADWSALRDDCVIAFSVGLANLNARGCLLSLQVIIRNGDPTSDVQRLTKLAQDSGVNLLVIDTTPAARHRLIITSDKSENTPSTQGTYRSIIDMSANTAPHSAEDHPENVSARRSVRSMAVAWHCRGWG